MKRMRGLSAVSAVCMALTGIAGAIPALPAPAAVYAAESTDAPADRKQPGGDAIQFTECVFHPHILRLFGIAEDVSESDAIPISELAALEVYPMKPYLTHLPDSLARSAALLPDPA